MKFPFKRMDWPVWLAFFGALVSAIAAVIASTNQSKESEENKKLYKQIAESALENNRLYKQLAEQSTELAKQSAEIKTKTIENAAIEAERSKEVRELQKQVIVKQEELNEKANIQNTKTEQIAKLNAELLESQKEVTKLSQTVNNYMSGGDGFCYITLRPISGTTKIEVKAKCVGRFPLTVSEIVIHNYSETDRVAGDNGPMRRGMINAWNIRTTPSFSNLHLMPSIHGTVIGEIDNKDWLYNDSYSIEFRALNGSWKQHISWKSITQTITVWREDKKIFDEQMSYSY